MNSDKLILCVVIENDNFVHYDDAVDNGIQLFETAKYEKVINSLIKKNITHQFIMKDTQSYLNILDSGIQKQQHILFFSNKVRLDENFSLEFFEELTKKYDLLYDEDLSIVLVSTNLIESFLEENEKVMDCVIEKIIDFTKSKKQFVKDKFI